MRIARFALTAAAAFPFAACKGFTEPGPRAVVLVPLVAETAGVVGELTESPPGVTVTDESDQPVRGVIVEFRPLNVQHGMVSSMWDTTDAMGIARAGTWRLGTTAGLQRLAAYASRYSRVTTMTAVARAGPVTDFTPAMSLKQSVLSGRNPLPPAIRASDRYNNSVSGIGVEFTAGTGGGSVGVASATTNAQGIASTVTWSVPSAVGTYSVAASSGSLVTNFTAQRVDSSTLIWYELDSVIFDTRRFTPTEYNIKTARLGLSPFDPCLCTNLNGLYFEIVDYINGIFLHSELSGDFRVIDGKISMQFVDTVKIAATSVQLKRIDSYYSVLVTSVYKRKP